VTARLPLFASSIPKLFPSPREPPAITTRCRVSIDILLIGDETDQILNLKLRHPEGSDRLEAGVFPERMLTYGKHMIRGPLM
jgi:hypothetical protein